MSIERLPQITTISWSLQEGVKISYPQLPQMKTPTCPVKGDDGVVREQSEVLRPGVIYRCKENKTEGSIEIGFLSGGTDIATAYDKKEGLYGESGPLIGVEVPIALRDKNGETKKVLTIGGPTCGQLEGECKIISIKQITGGNSLPQPGVSEKTIQQTPVPASPTVVVPTQITVPTPTAVFHSDVGQAQPISQDNIYFSQGEIAVGIYICLGVLVSLILSDVKKTQGRINQKK